MQKLILIYLILVNLLGFFIMGNDKRRAKKQLWRIPEKNLFLIALIGGSLGTNLGMKFFRHKTKHWYFIVGMPLIFVLQVGLGAWLLRR